MLGKATPPSVADRPDDAVILRHDLSRLAEQRKPGIGGPSTIL